MEAQRSRLLDDLVEIAQLSHAQLDAKEMGEGAQAIWGLMEWPLAAGGLREHLRFLAGFTPKQRALAVSATGLPLAQMSPEQQQRFLSFAFGAGAEALPSREELVGATLRVEHTSPAVKAAPAPGEGEGVPAQPFLGPVPRPIAPTGLRLALVYAPGASH